MRVSTIRACLSTLEACTRDVKRWFAENDLLLNADKSEVMMIGTPAQLRAASTVDTVAVANAKTEIARCDIRFQAVVRRPRRSGVQDVQLSHLGASAHPATTTTRRGADTGQSGLLHRRRKAG